jgi:hypothetical protein
MYLVYSALALVETCIFLASAAAMLFLIVRGTVRAFRTPAPEARQAQPESAHRLKRADARQSG